MRLTPVLAIILALSACTLVRQPTRMLGQDTRNWQEVITEKDRARLNDWRKTFIAALAAARASGHPDEIAREGPLLDPDAALPGPALPNGTYSCRMIKLGASGTGLRDFVALPARTCRIIPENGLQLLKTIGGPQRPVGIIFADDAMRGVFLGSLVLGDEQGAFQYGLDEQRDIVGYVERVGAQRWRLVMPRPVFESQLDVMELVPSTGGTR